MTAARHLFSVTGDATISPAEAEFMQAMREWAPRLDDVAQEMWDALALDDVELTMRVVARVFAMGFTLHEEGRKVYPGGRIA
jgi:hypothetical protein